MDKENILLGHTYECQPVGLQRRVIGEAVKKLENCLVLSVEHYDMVDHEEVEDRFGKVVVKYSEVYGKTMADSFFR
ncbi:MULTISPECIES: Hcp family type VI secretion system effector [Enterococcus]|uniref:hypothetical protein n=1 Tax=Enterococcus TaxID=1350 RepID=UPI00065DCF35|nr:MULTISPECIES: hypothetical protein [Enterococcus]KAF1299989.1 hypothetical protein BAU16_13265 [Enterococcus sp. JM9B]